MNRQLKYRNWSMRKIHDRPIYTENLLDRYVLLPCHQFPLEALPESSSPPSFLYWWKERKINMLCCLNNLRYIININNNGCNYQWVESGIACSSMRLTIYVLATIIDWWAKVTWLNSLFLINWTHILIFFSMRFTNTPLADIICIESKDKAR